MDEYFHYSDRLGIPIPNLELDWDEYSIDTQQSILLQWEKIRGTIPDRIADLEKEINEKQASLDNESDFDRSCTLNAEIAELASIINDLWIWFRTNPKITYKV